MRNEPTEIVIDGDIRVALKRSARARRMTLRVARAGGAVVLTLPARISVEEARAFAQSRAEWLRQTRGKMAAVQRVGLGVQIPVRGQFLRVTAAAQRRISVSGDMLLIPEGRPAGAVVTAWLKHIARDDLVRACDRYAAQIGLSYRAISLRDTRSRWGSCTHDGRLMFSWRLAMAPPEVLDYVAAHEVAHLRHMDHSAAFWSLTGSLMPDYAPRRDWLRTQGHLLQAWVFDDSD